MDKVINTLIVLMKKLIYFTLQFAGILFQWKLRFIKVQVQKWKRCSARKRMERSLHILGNEVYALYKQKETDWQRAPAVQEQLKIVEENESMVFHEDERIEAINSEYHRRREEIREKYQAKRAQAATRRPGEDTEEPSL